MKRIITLVLFAGCSLSGGALYAQTPANVWQTAMPASMGIDEKELDAIDKDLASGKYLLVDSFTVFRCGKQIYDRNYSHDYAKIYGKEAKEKGPLNARLTGPYNYFDPAWHPFYKGTDLHTMQSISKTVTSIIIGIAKTRGFFKAGVDTPVLKYFDVAKVKNIDDRKRRMTLRDVLTMTAGIDWNEEVPYDDPKSDSSRMEAADDWVQYVIDKPMSAEPGKVFNYNSGSTVLLAYIFQKETGQDIDEYGEKFLFQPLGIKHFWKRTYIGVVDTEGGLYLSRTDLAKLGYLYLNDGAWDGKQIVSKEWVRESLKPYIAAENGFQYGYKWWLIPRKDSKNFIWMGRGFGGQRLMVFPEEGLIVTMTGWNLLDSPVKRTPIEERVLNSVKSKTCEGGVH